MLILLRMSCLAWRASERSRHTSPKFSYALAPGVCDRLTTYETRFAPRTDCESLHVLIRRAFDPWQIHSPSLTFVHVLGDSMIEFEAASLARNTLATAIERPSLRFRVTLNSERCWYLDRAFCETVHRVVSYHLFGPLVALWVVATFVAWCFPLCTRTRRAVAWWCSLAPPIVYWYALSPCLNCHDLLGALVHEIGHVLGLAHPEAPSDARRRHLCGCGASAVECPVAAASGNRTPPVMHHASTRRVCLTRDDADGIRSLFDPERCPDPVWCMEASPPSTERHATWLVVCIALASVFLADWRKKRQGSKRSESIGPSSARLAHATGT